LTPSSGEEYKKALHRYSDLSILEAKYIVLPSVFSDIPIVVSYATSQSPPIEIAVRCGGCHCSTWASSNGGLVIDLRNLNNVVVSEDMQSVLVQGGALWGDVYEETQKFGLDVVGAHYWFVGVGGYLLGGGHSRLSGEHGLGSDNVLAATVVLADGRIVKTSATEETDLFWAIRGGGNQFGIVVEFVLKTFPAANSITMGSLVYPGTEIANVLRVVQEWKKNMTSKEHLGLAFGRAAPYFQPAVMIMPYVSGDIDRAEKVLRPFRDTLKPIIDKSVSLPDMFAVSHIADGNFENTPSRLNVQCAITSDIWTDTALEVWDRWCKFTENDDCKQTLVIWEIGRPDKIAEVGKADTAFHVRDPHYGVIIRGGNRLPASDEGTRTFVSSIVDYIRKADALKTNNDLGFAFNFAAGDEAPEDVFGDNLPRLRKLKAKYDPTNVWSKGLVIEPDFD